MAGDNGRMARRYSQEIRNSLVLVFATAGVTVFLEKLIEDIAIRSVLAVVLVGGCLVLLFQQLRVVQLDNKRVRARAELERLADEEEQQKTEEVNARWEGFARGVWELGDLIEAANERIHEEFCDEAMALHSKLVELRRPFPLTYGSGMPWKVFVRKLHWAVNHMEPSAETGQLMWRTASRCDDLPDILIDASFRAKGKGSCQLCSFCDLYLERDPEATL